jgi:hypothetical protein
MLPYKQKIEMARELMRREGKYKKLYLCENQDKIRDDRGKEREKTYDWIAIYFQKTMHWKCSFYM